MLPNILRAAAPRCEISGGRNNVDKKNEGEK